MKKSGKILFIENDSATTTPVKMHLELEGFDTHVIGRTADALERYFDSHYDLVIVGLKQTGLAGLEICRRLRMADQCTPIVVLRPARDSQDVIAMLEAGADVCINHPFCASELIVRIKCILRLFRRAQLLAHGGYGDRLIEIDGLILDDENHRVSVRNATVKLTAKEYALLYLFASNPGKAFSRRLLLDLLWSRDADVYEHTVNSHINRLRRKIEANPASPVYILTEWGVGYRFTDQYS
jgi:DNA-binding response OmpR family regulator